MRKPSVNTILITATTVLSLFFLTRLEIDGFKIKTVIYPILWIGIGIFGFKYFKILRGSVSAIRKSFLGLGLVFYIFGTLYLGLRLFMCTETDYNASFTHKHDRSLSLICRTYNCYGTTDKCQLYKVRKLTKNIKWVTKFTETPVDTNNWER